MSIETIRGIVANLRKRYGNIYTDELCDALNVTVLYHGMGKSQDACKGFYTCQSRIKMAVVNADLPEKYQGVILAHELGHGVLHNDYKVHAFEEFEMFDSRSVCEYEANIFAAELLLPDEEVLEFLNDDMSFFQAAACLYVPPELLDFKFRVLKRLGYEVNNPLTSNSNFMKNIDREERF